MPDPGARMPWARPWHPSEDATLRAEWKRATKLPTLVALLDRHPESIKARAAALGMQRRHGPRHHQRGLVAIELQRRGLVAAVEGGRMTIAELSARYGVSRQTVQRWCKVLGPRK